MIFTDLFYVLRGSDEAGEREVGCEQVLQHSEEVEVGQWLLHQLVLGGEAIVTAWTKYTCKHTAVEPQDTPNKEHLPNKG